MIKFRLFNRLIENKIKRVPLSYVLGCKYFYKYEFRLKKFVLIPRYDSEMLIDVLSDLSIYTFLDCVLDLGTGCGVVALSFMKKFKDSCLLAVDKSYGVLEVASQNAFGANKNSIRFIYSDWFGSLFKQEYYNLIISNPPYLSKEEIWFFYSQIEFEPEYALKSFKGLQALYKISRIAYDFLLNNSFILLEHGYVHSKQIRKALICSGFINVCTFMDSNNVYRVSYGEK